MASHSRGTRSRWPRISGSDEFRAHALNSLGIARVGLGDRDGLADLEAAREIARAAGGPEYLRACGNLASTIFGFGELAPCP